MKLEVLESKIILKHNNSVLCEAMFDSSFYRPEQTTLDIEVKEDTVVHADNIALFHDKDRHQLTIAVAGLSIIINRDGTATCNTQGWWGSLSHKDRKIVAETYFNSVFNPYHKIVINITTATIFLRDKE